MPGPGSEPGESRIYQPGDDVRRMDWSVTARTTHPHVRQMIVDRELETWLVVDVSASLDFGTAGCEQRDLAAASAASIAILNSRGGHPHWQTLNKRDAPKQRPPHASSSSERRISYDAAHRPY